MRLFFAVELTPAVKDAVQRGIDGISPDRSPWRWVARDNFHITLKFLGERTADDVDMLDSCAAVVAGRHDAFPITLDTLGAFPKLARARVLFYRVTQGARPLVALANDLEHALAKGLGVERDRRPFRAHATVARLKAPPSPPWIDRLESAPSLVGAAQTVDRIVLMRSELRREGAIYQPVKGFALKKSKC